MLHRDLKSANVLLVSSSGGLAGGRLMAKIGDFGLASGISNTTLGDTTATAKHGGGTPAYKAPEVFKNRFTTASDVYSFGIIAWELLAAPEKPWSVDETGSVHSEASVMLAVVSGERPTIPPMPTAAAPAAAVTSAAGASSASDLTFKETAHTTLAGIIPRSWHADPSERPSFVSLREELATAVRRMQRA